MVTMITGISASSLSCRNAASTDHPSRSAMITSRVITRPQFLGELESFQSTRRGHDRKSFGLELIRKKFARGGIVVDDEDAIAFWPAATLLEGSCRTIDAPWQADSEDARGARAAGRADAADRRGSHCIASRP